MVALGVDSRDKVDRVHRKALELGGTDEVPAGPRGDGFYAGYFRDLDGNKLSVLCMGSAPSARAHRSPLTSQRPARLVARPAAPA